MTEKRIIDTEEGLKEYYEWEAELVDYRNLDERNYQLEQRRTEIIMDLLELENATSLLDIGCGEGLQLERDWQNSFLKSEQTSKNLRANNLPKA